jgi:uncharacterized protein YegL
MNSINYLRGEIGEAERRILIYLVLDVSGSMQGAPLEAVNEGVNFLNKELRNTPEAVQLAHLCVIVFGSRARVVHPLVPLMQFNPPQLKIEGSTNMGEALELVAAEIDRNFRPNLGGQVKGDYKPLIFLLTDGAPDDLNRAINAGQALINRPSGRTIGTFLALGCGPNANLENLKQIAKAVAYMQDMNPDNIKKFFQWLTASIGMASRRASRGTDAGEEGMAPPPIPKDNNGQEAFRFDF